MSRRFGTSFAVMASLAAVAGPASAAPELEAGPGFELTCEQPSPDEADAEHGWQPDWSVHWTTVPEGVQHLGVVEDGRLSVKRAEQPGHLGETVLDGVAPERHGRYWTFRFDAVQVGFAEVSAWGGNTAACSLNAVALPHPHGDDAPARVSAVRTYARPLVFSLALEEAKHHLRSWNHPAAARRAAELLDADPAFIDAHGVYMWAWSFMHGRAVVLEQYRAWLEEAPEDPARRLLRAMALASSLGADASDCAEIEDLLDPLPEDPDLRYHALKLLSEVHEGQCPGDATADHRRLLELDGHTDDGQAWMLRERLREGPVDDALARDLGDRVRAHPWDLALARGLWSRDARGPALRRARRATLAAARRWAGDDRVVVLQAARNVLEKAGRRDEADGIDARLLELDPERPQPVDRVEGLEDEILGAWKALDPEAGLARLEALRPDVPASGTDRATFELARRHHLNRLERHDEALDARRLAWLATPDDPAGANGFAFAAALAGDHLDEALQAIDRAIAVVEAGVYDPTHWDGSTDYAQRQRWDARRQGALRDTRAWVLHRLGRNEEAATEMRRSLLLHDAPVGHLHLGLIYAALGLDDPAADHLARGLAQGPSSEATLDEEARRVLDRLEVARGWWHPDGLDGYLAALGATLHDPPGPSEPAEPGSSSHRLVGDEFPDLEVRVRGKRKRRVSDYEGVRVIDVWATWCGPCVEGLPHLDEIALSYADRGVTVLAVSVDEDYAEVDALFEGVEPPAYELVWAPAAMDELDLRAVPAVFVLDPDGLVRDYIQGGGADDLRVDQALDRLLEELAAAPD